MRNLLLSAFMVFTLTGCATTLKPLEDKKGAVYSGRYNAPAEYLFKIAKSAAYRSPCAASVSIYDDELRSQIYSIFRSYGMIPEYVWLISVVRIDDGSSMVELSWSPYVVSEGCFTKDLFSEIGTLLTSRKP